MICTGTRYWPYIGPMVESARQFLLKGYEVEYLLWTDCDADYGCTVFKAEDVGMPWATLMRYHWFLEQEEYLKKFDYLFYCDCDMKFVGEVGKEILSPLTATQHPGYAFAPPAPDPERTSPFFLPFERNPKSKAFIRTPRYYFAGGFQGGETAEFIKAMKSMKAGIDEDLKTGYIAMWQDESHWNKYCFENPPHLILDPSYCYPDSLVDVFYKRVWGQDYEPKLVCITKPHQATKEGGDVINKMIKNLENFGKV